MAATVRTPELVARATDMYRRGNDFIEIGGACGVSNVTAFRWLVDAGVHKPNENRTVKHKPAVTKLQKANLPVVHCSRCSINLNHPAVAALPGATMCEDCAEWLAKNKPLSR